MSDFFRGLDDLEGYLHLHELTTKAKHAMVGGEIDPLKVLLDPEVTEPWEYDLSKTEIMMPGQMHPKQIEALNDPGRHRWLFWANQTGKTTCGAIDVSLLALGRHPQQRWEPGVLIWASALTWDLWENILLPEILTWIPPERIVDAPPPKQRSTKRVIKIRADNGKISYIVGKSAEQGAAKYQSARVNHVWLDEEHPESVWDEIQPRLLRFGGTTICTATPLLGLTWMYHRIYAPWRRGKLLDHYCSHAGLADNPSITPDLIEAITKEFENDPAQAQARLYGKFATPSGIAIRFDPNRHTEDWSDEKRHAQVFQENWNHVCGIDFGYWRFAFVHLVVDPDKRAHVVYEYFSQKEDLSVRAQRIHDHLTQWRAPSTTRLWGDAANPTDISEVNRELKRIESPYRIRAVRAENKARPASVRLVNTLLHRDALVVDKALGQTNSWRLGQSAASEGSPQIGSRLLYEISQWRYPKPGADQAQRQDPDDNTADGADMIAALRYAIMSHYKGGEGDVEVQQPLNPNIDYGLERLAARVKEEIVR